MKVRELIALLENSLLDSEVGQWRANFGEVCFMQCDGIGEEVINGEILVGLSFGQKVRTVKIKDWPKHE